MQLNPLNTDSIISYLVSPAIQKMLLIPKIIVLFFWFSLLGFVIYLLLTTNWLRFRFLESLMEFFTYKPYGVKKLDKTWKKVIARLETMNESEYKLAVIEADDLLETILKKMGYPGKDLESRLKNLTSATISNIDQVFTAHKTRDDIVHDPDYRLDVEQTRKILEIYERAFRNLQAL